MTEDEPNYLTHPELFPGASSHHHKLMPHEARKYAQSWLDSHEKGQHSTITYSMGWAYALAFLTVAEARQWDQKRKDLAERIKARNRSD